MSEQGNQFYNVYEVFSKKTDKAPFQHQFSLLAPNADMALVMAKENFFRRETVADIWVVKRENIRGLTQSEREMLKRLDKDYRETKGYGYLKKKWRDYNQEQFTEQHIMGGREESR
ncbi:1,2-phenylacetyl-CoA epoxidase subunit B [Fictibacillus sp. WQ 8-8]|uniref:1,2-phenylacetyl-CoA epoxidase subunit PaaB n=1 Tax=unclassified Fictibacillus TaxID=2644029 RepID=UPI0006A7DD13|nr:MULTISPECIES: 1,2-phenylacetyl-CoA epoxidase subunit PaaB [unclassified Fictibacillus]MCQ6267001.1 1,2-phenylacetyl-CoA epoxidase subunit B [Fictibacillus sp. WQ 8-8]MED2974034.1 1,2-phenylacetyl-CoA epoxidase subunit B [Fictibacillus sp. B-59209]SFE20986.1 ring-1,2-phenylacetyl-CoA epoxidase subunit PaaB [Bacillus sp. OV194]